MALKSYRLKVKKNNKKRKNNSIEKIVRTGIGATIGVAFISTLTGIIN